jgi:hypothetical protein
VLRVRFLGIVEFDLYSGLVRAMEADGYRLGDLGDPRPEDSFFFFTYDWRAPRRRSCRRAWSDCARAAATADCT